MINWLFFCTFVLSLTMTILGILVDVTYQVQYAPVIDKIHSQHQQSLNSYLEQKNFYLKHPLFRPRLGERKDFAERISLLQQGDLAKPLIDKTVKKSLFSMGKQWLDQKHKIPKLENVEKLFADIQEYDHWILPSNPDNDLASDLIVADQIFLAWTFHFQPSAIRQALEGSRQLSEILLTTQDLNYKRAGLSLLEKEAEFVAFLKTRMRNARLLWTPISQKELKAFRKHLQQTASYLTPLAEPSLFAKVFFSEKPAVGFCAVYKEKYKLLKWSEGFLSPNFPLEPNFSASVKNMHQIQLRAEEECLHWKSPQPPPVSWFRHIPFYRRIYGVKMINNAETKRSYL